MATIKDLKVSDNGSIGMPNDSPDHSDILAHYLMGCGAIAWPLVDVLGADIVDSAKDRLQVSSFGRSRRAGAGDAIKTGSPPPFKCFGYSDCRYAANPQRAMPIRFCLIASTRSFSKTNYERPLEPNNFTGNRVEHGNPNN